LIRDLSNEAKAANRMAQYSTKPESNRRATFKEGAETGRRPLRYLTTQARLSGWSPPGKWFPAKGTGVRFFLIRCCSVCIICQGEAVGKFLLTSILHFG